MAAARRRPQSPARPTYWQTRLASGRAGVTNGHMIRIKSAVTCLFSPFHGPEERCSCAAVVGNELKITKAQRLFQSPARRGL